MHALDVLGFWSRHLDALDTEVARARRERHPLLEDTPSAEGRPSSNDEKKDE
ncbi:hypothetical protein ABT158_30960 [Nonomuraea sp. NPDC001636]|uniref:hypothetical protein n=1 Tax=Nonomuraea sp. NPDC001636 TaxID=3154391 RepID=UPI0033282C07